MAHTAADQLVQRLIEWGIDTIFGLPGDGINGVMESLRTRQDQVRFIHVRHEETAAPAACAYGKFTGRPSACLSTAAPGPNGPTTPRPEQRYTQVPARRPQGRKAITGVASMKTGIGRGVTAAPGRGR